MKELATTNVRLREDYPLDISQFLLDISLPVDIL
jgi:hypothetical protein